MDEIALILKKYIEQELKTEIDLLEYIADDDDNYYFVRLLIDKEVGIQMVSVNISDFETFKNNLKTK